MILRVRPPQLGAIRTQAGNTLAPGRIRPKAKRKSQLSKFKGMRLQTLPPRTRLRQTREPIQGSRKSWTSPRRKMPDRALLSRSHSAYPRKSHPSDSRRRRTWKRRRLARRPRPIPRLSSALWSHRPQRQLKMPNKSQKLMAPLMPALPSRPRPRRQSRAMTLPPLSILKKKLRLRRLLIRLIRLSSAARSSLMSPRAWAPLAMSEIGRETWKERPMGDKAVWPTRI